MKISTYLKAAHIVLTPRLLTTNTYTLGEGEGNTKIAKPNTPTKVFKKKIVFEPFFFENSLGAAKALKRSKNGQPILPNPSTTCLYHQMCQIWIFDIFGKFSDFVSKMAQNAHGRVW
jgi:hypothetical protein